MSGAEETAARVEALFSRIWARWVELGWIRDRVPDRLALWGTADPPPDAVAAITTWQHRLDALENALRAWCEVTYQKFYCRKGGWDPLADSPVLADPAQATRATAVLNAAVEAGAPSDAVVLFLAMAYSSLEARTARALHEEWGHKWDPASFRRGPDGL